MTIKKHDIYFWFSLVFATWFALTAFLWTYFMNLFISLPFGIVSYFLWRAGKKNDTKPKRYKIISTIWIIGIIFSLVVLVYFLLYE